MNTHHALSNTMTGPWQVLSPTVARRAVIGRRGPTGYAVATEYRSTEHGRTVTHLLAVRDYPTAEAAAEALTVRIAQVAA